MKEKRVFVAGATGVLGRRVVELLVSQGHAVTGVARSAARAEGLRESGAEPVEIDLFDPHAVRGAVRGHDAVMNLATSIPPGSAAARKSSWAMNHRIRREASDNLALAAAIEGVSTLIQESITLLYGDGGVSTLDERAPTEPTWITASALDAERHCLRFGQRGGAAVVLRFAGFYGSDSHHTQDLITAAHKGWAMSMGPRSAYLSSITTDDAARAAVAALNATSGVYNVSDDAALTREEHFAALADALGMRRLRHPPAFVGRLMGPKMAMVLRSHRVVSDKFKTATGWKPKHSDAWSGWRAIVGVNGTRGSPRGAPEERLRRTTKPQLRG